MAKALQMNLLILTFPPCTLNFKPKKPPQVVKPLKNLPNGTKVQPNLPNLQMHLHKGLKIASLNVNGIRGHHDELKHFIS